MSDSEPFVVASGAQGITLGEFALFMKERGVAILSARQFAKKATLTYRLDDMTVIMHSNPGQPLFALLMVLASDLKNARL